MENKEQESGNRKYDCVDTHGYAMDTYHAPYETIQANSRNQAKYKYVKMHPQFDYKNILCRNHRQGSFSMFP